MDGFNEMIISPLCKESLLEAYPVLRGVPVFSVDIKELTDGDSRYIGWQSGDADLLLRFIVATMSRDSPLFHERDFEKRAKKAMRVLRIKSGSLVHKEINAEGLLFRKYLFYYFKLVGDYSYEAWNSLKSNFHILCEYLRSRGEDGFSEKSINARRQLQGVIAEARKELVEMEEMLFTSPKIERIIKDEAAADGIGGYPERFAQTI